MAILFVARHCLSPWLGEMNFALLDGTFSLEQKERGGMAARHVGRDLFRHPWVHAMSGARGK